MPNPITADCLTEIAGIGHGFFTREGGVSGGIYGALNCGVGSRDERAHVLENRRRVASYLGTQGEQLLTCHQVHSAEAVVVTEPFPPGALPKADALVTRVPGIALGALAADCAPVLFADPEARIIGAAHAGWKGALTGILEATIAAMVRLGARPGRIRAALGPCIGPDAYEVGAEFEDRFIETDPANARFFRRAAPQARPRFDLPGYVLDRLARAGLDTVESVTACTYSDEQRLFSYRRSVHNGEPDYGRQVSAVVLL
ncbi:MAG: peptidoglycan editing factor PgeF [Hyphomicrobiaceae bacterium]|nr:peptidoglycan editing factor PgeF [Hyphomicrobiaceae bacterium]